MARVIILSIKDNDAAEAIVNQILDVEDPHAAGWGSRVATLGIMLASSAKVEAVIARPTSPCRCKGKKVGYVRTPRFGWIVHRSCNRPSYYLIRDFIKNLYVSYNNLLDEILEARANRPEPDITEYTTVDYVEATGLGKRAEALAEAANASEPELPPQPDQTWSVRSHTDPNTTYTIERRGTGLIPLTDWAAIRREFSCNCPQDTYRGEEAGPCKHIVRLIRGLQAERLEELAGDNLQVQQTVAALKEALGKP